MPHYTLFVGNWQAFKMTKPGSRARSYSQVFVPSWLNPLGCDEGHAMSSGGRSRQGFSEFKRRPGDSHLFGTRGSQKMARYGSLSVFLTSGSRVTVTWVNSLKSPALKLPPHLPFQAPEKCDHIAVAPLSYPPGGGGEERILEAG